MELSPSTEIPGIGKRRSLDSGNEEDSDMDLSGDESGDEDLIESIALTEIHDDWFGIDID